MLECGECGFDYLPDWSRSVRAHVIAHEEWLRGTRLGRPEAFECVGAVQEFRALLVRPSSCLFARRRAERLARRAIREPLNEGCCDKPLYFAEGPDSPPELHAHALLLARGKCAVGMLVLERRPVFEFYRWTIRPQFEPVGRLADTIRWTIVHVWLLPELRGHGTATGLVHLAVEGVRETPDTVGWLSPYTKAGLRLIARVTQKEFHRVVSSDLPPLTTVDPPFSS
jgi:hypothetical protein